MRCGDEESCVRAANLKVIIIIVVVVAAAAATGCC